MVMVVLEVVYIGIGIGIVRSLYDSMFNYFIVFF